MARAIGDDDDLTGGQLPNPACPTLQAPNLEPTHRACGRAASAFLVLVARPLRLHRFMGAGRILILLGTHTGHACCTLSGPLEPARPVRAEPETHPESDGGAVNQTASSAIVHGAIAGAAASVPQVMVGKLEDFLLLPASEDSHIAPRLVDRLADRLGRNPSREQEWVMGSIFHVVYGAGWGAAYALATRRRRVHPLIGGAMLGTLIYGITFPRWGGAVLTGTERPPERRTSRMTLVAWSVALSFGVVTGFLYDRLSRREAQPASPTREAGRPAVDASKEEGSRAGAILSA